MATRRLALLVAAVLASAWPAEAQGHVVGRDARVYAGVGVGSSIGVIVTGTSPVVDVFTRDAALYVVYRSGEGADDGRLVAAVGVGVGLRLLRLASIARTRGIPTGDLDVGIRVGPSFSVGLGAQSEAQRARAFAVFADPFARATRRVRGVDAFAEVGAQAPTIRVGVSASLGR